MLFAANLVLAEESRIEMSKLTCKQFAAYDKDNVSIIMMWLEGYCMSSLTSDRAEVDDNVLVPLVAASRGFSRLCHDMRA